MSLTPDTIKKLVISLVIVDSQNGSTVQDIMGKL